MAPQARANENDSSRKRKREEAISHHRSALRVSQISRLMAQSGPCSRWLVALSTRDAAGSRAGGGPVATGYIASPAPPAEDQGLLLSIPARRRSGVVRDTEL